ncbi:hypothetical protein DP117_13800 [Brasilonema sp. UFV-L1]|nr:hypothetical protein [Brasilonema sp. UFV-L1]
MQSMGTSWTSWPSLLAALKSFPLLSKERDARQGRVRFSKERDARQGRVRFSKERDARQGRVRF